VDNKTLKCFRNPLFPVKGSIPRATLGKEGRVSVLSGWFARMLSQKASVGQLSTVHLIEEWRKALLAGKRISANCSLPRQSMGLAKHGVGKLR
jgi:hypothetical protein